jgi:hypothetical protein
MVHIKRQAWWYMPITPATKEAEIGRMQFEVEMGKSARANLKKQTKAKVLAQKLKVSI